MPTCEIEIERAAIGEEGDQRPENAERAERDDEGLDPSGRHQNAVEGAGGRADQQAGDDADRRSTGMPVPSEGTSELMMMIIMPAVKAAIEPTDRSSPPEVMTKVAPTAMMPMNEARATILAMLADGQEIAVERRAEDQQQRQRDSGPSTPILKARPLAAVAVVSFAAVVMLLSRFRCPSGT